jgi:hypothetical protein
MFIDNSNRRCSKDAFNLSSANRVPTRRGLIAHFAFDRNKIARVRAREFQEPTTSARPKNWGYCPAALSFALPNMLDLAMPSLMYGLKATQRESCGKFLRAESFGNIIDYFMYNAFSSSLATGRPLEI